ncbi:MAG: TSUP family transporter [Candidatus Nanopelagicaceae bacterium]
MELSVEVLAFLLLVSCFAGFVDAISGGGGLIQLPALLLGMPTSEPATVLGTNKVPSFIGTTSAMINYLRRIKIDLRFTLLMAIPAFLGSMTGAHFASRIPKDAFRPIILVMLIAVAIYTFTKKDLGLSTNHRHTIKRRNLIAAISGLLIGFYDGIFGPGTGSFIALILVAVIGFAFLEATAMTKIVNWGTNLAAIITFQLTGHIVWAIGLALGAANLLGALLGVRVAVRGGSALIRKAFIAVVILLIVRLGYDIANG